MTTAEVVIRLATPADWPAIWALFQTVVAGGDVFAYDVQTPELVARKLWVEPPSLGYVAEYNGRFAGTYFLRPNQPGHGDHVANGGYMVDPDLRGRGLATHLCQHSLNTARLLGFRAIQFNCVVSTNVAAIRTWERCGFAIVGRIPKAFRHVTAGDVEVLIMHREL